MPAGAWKSWKGICSVRRRDCPKEVLLHWIRWPCCSSWSRDHRFFRGIIIPTSLDVWGRTGAVCGEVLEVWLHRTPQLLPRHGHVNFMTYILSMIPFYVAHTHKSTPNTGTGVLLHPGTVQRSRCLRSSLGVRRTSVSSPSESSATSRAGVSSPMFQTLRSPSLKATISSSKNRPRGWTLRYYPSWTSFLERKRIIKN